MAQAGDYRLASVKGCSCTGSGETLNADLKLFVYSGDGTVFFELRRLVLPLLQGFIKEFKLHRFVKDQSDAFAGQCLLIGVVVEDALKPSVRAASFASEAALCDPKVRSEWTIRSDALLAMLAFWAHQRHITQQRQRAEGFLEIIAM